MDRTSSEVLFLLRLIMVTKTVFTFSLCCPVSQCRSFGSLTFTKNLSFTVDRLPSILKEEVEDSS